MLAAVPATDPPSDRSILPAGFRFGVATAGFQIEGGFNGPGEPANNWVRWERAGRVEPSGLAVDFWNRSEEHLDRAAAMGCDAFRLGVEWARVEPVPGADRRRRPRSLRGHPRRMPGPGHGAARHAAPFHPPRLAGRGLLALG